MVGHALWNDLSVRLSSSYHYHTYLLERMRISVVPDAALISQWIKHRHPYEDMRDTSLYYPLRKLVNVEREGDQGSLKKLAKKVLDQDVQTGFHCPVS